MKLLLPALLLVIAAQVWRHRVMARQRQQASRLQRLQAFIAHAPDFSGAHLDQVVAAIGPWTAADDWDWGRIAYEWTHPQLRLRVLTQSQSVQCIELLDPRDHSRFGSVLETPLETSGKREDVASPQA